MQIDLPRLIRIGCAHILLLTGLSFAQEIHQKDPYKNPENKHSWSNLEKTLASLYITGSLIDAGQTLYGVNKNAIELNPLMGKKPKRFPIYALKSAAATIIFSICHHGSHSEKKWLLIFANCVQWSAVTWNASQKGIGFRLQF